MYEIYETKNQKIPSYYTIEGMYHEFSDKRLNLQFKIYNNLMDPYFEKVNNGNKSIIYDHVHIVLEEFQLKDLTDDQLWNITIITWKILEKKSNNYAYIVLTEIFKEIEEYLRKEKIDYERLGRYGKFSRS